MLAHLKPDSKHVVLSHMNDLMSLLYMDEKFESPSFQVTRVAIKFTCSSRYKPNNTHRFSMGNLQLFKPKILNQSNQFISELFSFRPYGRLNWYI